MSSANACGAYAVIILMGGLVAILHCSILEDIGSMSIRFLCMSLVSMIPTPACSVLKDAPFLCFPLPFPLVAGRCADVCSFSFEEKYVVKSLSCSMLCSLCFVSCNTSMTIFVSVIHFLISCLFPPMLMLLQLSVAIRSVGVCLMGVISVGGLCPHFGGVGVAVS